MTGDVMPQYMFKSPQGVGYLFRRGVPADVREAIGKREFKHTLGGDYKASCKRCRELAVETDQLIAAARNPSTPPATASGESGALIAHLLPPLMDIREVTPDLISKLYSTVIEQVCSADKARRHGARIAANPVEKLKEIDGVRRWATLAMHGEETAVCGWLPMLTTTLERQGCRLADELRDTAQERELCIEYATAYRDALDILQAEYSGQPPPHRPPAVQLKSAALVTSQKLVLSKAISEFLKHLQPGKRAMNEKHGFILPAFLEVVGDMPVSELRQSHIKDFLHVVQKLPPRWSSFRRKTGKSIRELSSQTWDETLSLKTYEDTYLASLRTFVDSSVSDWQDVGFPTTLTAKVPYVGSRTKTERKQRALRPDEIRQIFHNEKMAKIIRTPAQVHKFWLLALELYTGARVREICQVNPQQDWGREEGQWWLRFTDEAGELPDPDVIKSMKTGKSRTIPLHPELVRLGLPDYLERVKETGARRLFPRWAPTQGDAGSAPAKWVTNYLQSIGLHGVENQQGNALRGSHAFRHTLLTYGRLNGVNLRGISGHAEHSDNVVADGYEDRTMLAALPDLAALLKKLDYGVELPRPL